MRQPLLLRLDAGREIGLGHAVRVRHLLAALGEPPLAAVVGRGEALAACFPGQRVVVADDLPAALAAEGRGAAACLFDPPAYEAGEWRAVGEALGLPTILVDDFGGPFPAGLAINGTLLPEYHRYPALAPGGRALCGPRYALLHPAFAAAKWRGEAAATTLTVVAGGGERSVRWLRMLLDHGLDPSWGPLRLVVGSAFPLAGELAAKAAARGIETHQGVASERLAALLADSRRVLATAGMVAYECLALGVPVLLFPQVANLVGEAAGFAARGAAVDLGYDGGMDAAIVRRSVEAHLADPDAAAAQAGRGRDLVDGRGLARAAAAVREFLA